MSQKSFSGRFFTKPDGSAKNLPTVSGVIVFLVTAAVVAIVAIAVAVVSWAIVMLALIKRLPPG
jgi:hypothetical protein